MGEHTEPQGMNRPKVVTYALASVDGRITLAPGVLLLYGNDIWASVAGAQSEVQAWLKATHRPDVILDGSGGLVPEGVAPADLSPVEGDVSHLYQDFLPAEIVDRPAGRGWFAIVDGRGRVRNWMKEWPGEEWAGWHLLVLVSATTPAPYLAYLQSERIPYLVAGDGRVDLAVALQKMAEKLGVGCVLSEGAGRLNGALLRAGLIDEINVEFFPAAIGGMTTPSLFDSPELEAGEWPTRLILISAQVGPGGRAWLRYGVES